MRTDVLEKGKTDMFDLSDKRPKRRKIIMGYAQMDAQHGVLLAAMDFEWTCRRAILALSKTSTPTLYERFIKEYSSFKGLEKAWRVEVIPHIKDAISLRELVGRKVDWDMVCAAMQCRNMIIHGTESRVNDKECRWAVFILEDACDVVADFTEEYGTKSIFEPLNRRRPKKEIEAETTAGKKLKSWHDFVEKQIACYDECHWIRTGRIV